MKTKEKLLFEDFCSLIVDYVAGRGEKFVLKDKLDPAILSSGFDFTLGESVQGNSSIMDMLNKVFSYSLDTSHPLFMNQLYGGTDLIGNYGDFLSSLLNTSMATFEISPFFTMVEKECINKLGNFAGYQNADGTFTAGGSISNISALILARNKKFPDSRFKNLKELPDFSIFISEMAHYSFLKGVMLLGFGKESLVKVKSDSRGIIDSNSLSEEIKKEREKGRVPLMLVGTAGTTINGVFDNLYELGKISQLQNMWFHIDACYGGSLLFSEKYRQKLKGIELSDSVSWNLHKMMGIPLICSALLVRDKGLLEKSFSVNVDYLFHEEKSEFDLGNKSLQCGRRADAFKLWLSWKYHGDMGFSNRVNQMIEKAVIFSKKIKEHKHFQLFCEPESAIVCFQYAPVGFPRDYLNDLNIKIRNIIFQQGEIIFSYAEIKGKTVLRCVISNPEITEKQMDLILNKIEEAGRPFLNQ